MAICALILLQSLKVMITEFREMETSFRVVWSVMIRAIVVVMAALGGIGYKGYHNLYDEGEREDSKTNVPHRRQSQLRYLRAYQA